MPPLLRVGIEVALIGWCAPAPYPAWVSASYRPGKIGVVTESIEGVGVRRATTGDVRGIGAVVRPLARQGILLAKEWVDLYEAVQEFVVAERDGVIVGCGALHVMWDDLAEVRTIAVHDDLRGTGVGRALLSALLDRARRVGVSRVFCLTFEREFFLRNGFVEIEGSPVSPDIYAELLRSHDDGVAEFLDLARVKPNTLGNARMFRTLT